MNLWLAHGQIVLLETTEDLWASWHKAIDFFVVFSSFELGGITKHLMSGPAGNSEFCFPMTSMFPQASSLETLRVSGKQNSLLIPWGQSFKYLLTLHVHLGWHSIDTQPTIDQTVNQVSINMLIGCWLRVDRCWSIRGWLRVSTLYCGCF